MARVVFAPAALSDLFEIGNYVAMDSPAAAARLVASFKKQAASLAEAPGVGRARPEFGAQLRSFAVGKYVIFYRAIEGGVEIVRVLHGARDIDQILGD